MKVNQKALILNGAYKNRLQILIPDTIKGCAAAINTMKMVSW